MFIRLCLIVRRSCFKITWDLDEFYIYARPASYYLQHYTFSVFSRILLFPLFSALLKSCKIHVFQNSVHVYRYSVNSQI